MINLPSNGNSSGSSIWANNIKHLLEFSPVLRYDLDVFRSNGLTRTFKDPSKFGFIFNTESHHIEAFCLAHIAIQEISELVACNQDVVKELAGARHLISAITAASGNSRFCRSSTRDDRLCCRIGSQE